MNMTDMLLQMTLQSTWQMSQAAQSAGQAANTQDQQGGTSFQDLLDQRREDVTQAGDKTADLKDPKEDQTVGTSEKTDKDPQNANLEVVAGTAPEALEALSAPDRVFLGGTSGSLEDILNVIFRKNPAARVVCTAVTLETVGEAARCFAGLEGADMVQVAVTRTRPAGRYHLMDAQNPVWIFSGEGRA